MFMHPNLTERVLKITGSIKTKQRLAEYIKISNPKKQWDLSPTAFEDNTETRRERLHRHF